MILILNGFANAQNKKDVKKYFIKSVTESVSEKVNGVEIVRIKSRKNYDSSGNIVEETDYNNDGILKNKTVRKFNSKNDVTEELITANNKKIIRYVIYSYNHSNELISVKKYAYEF